MNATYRTQAEQAEITRLTKRIAELEATPRMLVGSDSGTHGKPLIQHVYEEITGERYATASFANANATRCTVQSALGDTEGYMRWFATSEAEIRELQKELRECRKQLKKLSHG